MRAIARSRFFQTNARQGYANLIQPGDQRRWFARNLAFPDNLALASMTQMHEPSKDTSIPA
jgi:hypothetical protein